MQYDAHVNARIKWMLEQIMRALGVWYSLEDWYACGDELI
jgi:hypothetical protein